MEEPGGLQSMGSKASDTTEQLHLTSLVFFSEGQGESRLSAAPGQTSALSPRHPTGPTLSSALPAPTTGEGNPLGLRHPAMAAGQMETGEAFSDHVSR